MLQLIRDKSQGWLAWIIVIGVCLTFALWGVHSYLYSSAAQNVVAKVAGVKITRQQLSITYNQMKREQQLQLGANYVPSAKSDKLLKQAALQALISAVVLHKAAVSDGFRVAPELVEALLARMPIFQVNGVFSQAKFEQYVNSFLYSTDSFLAQLHNMILVNQLKDGIMATAFLLPSEVDQTIKLVNQKRSFKYLIIPSKRFAATVHIPHATINNYYKQNIAKFSLPEKVSIQYLQLSVKDLMQKIQPSAAQLQQFYNNNITAYTKPKRWRLSYLMIKVSPHADKNVQSVAQKNVQAIVAKIKQGMAFSTLLKEYSTSTHANISSGEWPWMVAMQLPASVRKALLNLKTKGDISTPVKIQQGYIFLQLQGTQPQKILPYKTVKTKVLQAYRQQNAEQQFASLRDQLANITYENPDSLKSAAKQLNLPIRTTQLFTKNGSKTGITANPNIVTAAFSDNVLVQKNNSDPIDLNSSSVVVLRVKHHVAAKVKPLTQVKPHIIAIITKKITAQKAHNLGQQILAKLKLGQSAIYLAGKFKLKWHKATNLVRHATTNIDPEILTAAFNIVRPKVRYALASSGVALHSGDYVVIILHNVDARGVILSAAKRHVFQEAATNRLGLLEYQLYAHGLMQQAKIKTFNVFGGKKGVA